LFQRALRFDNLLEKLLCQAMRVFAAPGDQSGLKRQYQELHDLLADGMGIEPLPTTRKLYDRLLIKTED
jgi:DNA-binding SARP family transcriptional activator